MSELKKIPIKLKTEHSNVKKDSIEKPIKLIIEKPIKPIKLIKPKTFTKHFKQLFTNQEATNLFDYLKNNVKWQNSIYSSKAKQITRLGKSVSINNDHMIKWSITEAIDRMKLDNYIICQTYVNYYRNGEDFAPNHSHPDTVQLIISLNEPDGDRILNVGKNVYYLNNGDTIIFGSSTHGVPKQPNKKARISVATFMVLKEHIAHK